LSLKINFATKNRRTILNLHALLSDNLLGNPSASGRLRAIPVAIGKSVYEPLAVPQLIDEIFGQILDTVVAISDPFRLRYRKALIDCVGEAIRSYRRAPYKLAARKSFNGLRREE
jgi:hypothetical protein